MNSPLASDIDVPSVEYQWAVGGITVQQMVPGSWSPSCSPGTPGPVRAELRSGSFTRSLGLTLLNFLKVAKGPTHTTSIF